MSRVGSVASGPMQFFSSVGRLEPDGLEKLIELDRTDGLKWRPESLMARLGHWPGPVHFESYREYQKETYDLKNKESTAD